MSNIETVSLASTSDKSTFRTGLSLAASLYCNIGASITESTLRSAGSATCAITIFLKGDLGAGKTTLVRVVLGLLKPEHGRVVRRPGLRIGYGVASPVMINALHRTRQPFNVNVLAQHAALGALDDARFVVRSQKHNLAQKKYVTREIQKLGLSFIPSHANFILMRVNRPGKNVFQDMLRQGIIVRSMDEYGYHDWIRVTIGLKEENRTFIRALKHVLGKKEF